MYRLPPNGPIVSTAFAWRQNGQQILQVRYWRALALVGGQFRGDTNDPFSYHPTEYDAVASKLMKAARKAPLVFDSAQTHRLAVFCEMIIAVAPYRRTISSRRSDATSEYVQEEYVIQSREPLVARFRSVTRKKLVRSDGERALKIPERLLPAPSARKLGRRST